MCVVFSNSRVYALLRNNKMCEYESKRIFIVKIVKSWDIHGILNKFSLFVGWDGKTREVKNRAYIPSHLVGWEKGDKSCPMPKK